MKCGDICLAHYPFTDGSAAKLRPVIVVSADNFNVGEDVVVLPISSSPDRDDPHVVFIDSTSPHFSASGLRYPSAIKWTKPLTIAQAILVRRLGRLPEELVREVQDSLRSVFAEPRRG